MNVKQIVKKLQQHFRKQTPSRNDILKDYYDRLGEECETISVNFYDNFKANGLDVNSPRIQMILARLSIIVYNERTSFIQLCTEDEDFYHDVETAYVLTKFKILHDWRTIASNCYMSRDYCEKLCDLVEVEATLK